MPDEAPNTIACFMIGQKYKKNDERRRYLGFFLKNNGSYMTVINFFVYLCKELAMPFLIYYQDV
jgi:hypothetical protein